VKATFFSERNEYHSFGGCAACSLYRRVVQDRARHPLRTPRPGDITHRIGPSVPSPSLPARSYLVAPAGTPSRAGIPGSTIGLSQISRLARTTFVLEYARSLQGRYVYPLGYAPQNTGEREWSPDEDPADGIPDAGVALWRACLRYILGLFRALPRTPRRHRRRHWFCSCCDALGGLVGRARHWIPLVALDLRARRFRRAPLLHAGRKGIRAAARASGPHSRARVHCCRCGCCRCVLRIAVPVLRNTDRSRGAAARDTAGDHHASGDYGPDTASDDISNIIPNGLPNGISDRFTLSVRDGVAVKASQHVSISAFASPG
jgi:hypothetical protein